MTPPSSNHNQHITKKARQGSNDESAPQRNFTSSQLKKYDGAKEPKGDELKPLYLSINGIVFDVSRDTSVYGPDGPYGPYAGRECGAAFAKSSFDESDLDDVDKCNSLNDDEKELLNKWMTTFKNEKKYPIMGRLVPDDKLPSPERRLSKEDIAKYNGDNDDIPDGYAAAPIYVGIGSCVYDVSFGGLEFYGKGCGYNIFAGRDVSRALAKMSFETDDINNSDVSDLTERQLKVMNDWIQTFSEKKLYPCVGKIDK